MALYKRGGKIWFREESGRGKTFYPGVTIEIEVKEVLIEYQSLYQKIMVLDTPRFGRVLVLDGIIQTSEVDEYNYHVPMVAFSAGIHAFPRKILIVGGGDMGIASKLSRFPWDLVEEIDLVEIDKAVTEICQEYLSEICGITKVEARLNIYFENGANFVRSTEKSYDIIIIDSSEEIGPNKPLFGEEFYYHVREKLNMGGIMICQAGSMFYNREQVIAMYQMLQTKFPHLRVHRISVPLYMGDFALISALRGFPFPNEGQIIRMFSQYPKRENIWVNPKRYLASLVLPVDIEVELKRIGASS